MNTNHIELESRALNALIAEVAEALTADDTLTVSDALDEMEGIWMHTECPEIRSRAAAFMRQHAAYGEFYKFSA
ncbi:hypothetical protein [Shinella sumterensis]|uniref:Uncharacterized protein n=1 Tax=Shinella sumterensis TaxID=1967501 RepID=A0AA50H9A8_9HYPH|nr:hypothetical protein [Shinella sumterensis]WLR98749.1 hypothetical protein Q9313_06930 [Shinella sumterensis]